MSSANGQGPAAVLVEEPEHLRLERTAAAAYLAQTAEPSGAIADPGFFVDWPDFWAVDHNAADWLYPGLLAQGRAHAIYAGHKQGKSLLALWVAAELATGPDPVAVVYLDWEMTYADLQERLQDMGHGPATDLGRLHYALLPSLPPLDTAAGAAAVDEILDAVQADHPGHHLLVVIDTTSRAVQGEENSADTIQAYYRHTGLRLKQRGVTSVRLDHAGKDATRGQRGSSAKGDDVDVVWKLTSADGGVSLKKDASRIAWVPDHLAYAQGAEPLRYVRTGDQYPAGTSEVADLLDHHQLPVDITGNDAVKALREAGDGRTRQLVLAAVRYRKDQRP